MLTIRRSSDRGHADHGWLNTYHSFSFATYYDPDHMGFHSLRVINEDRVVGGAGFPTHPHANMEIISYVVSGALAHRDSMGNVETIGPGEIQAMTAGTGITHSEFNPSGNEPAHFLQIWLQPARNNLSPTYAQSIYDREQKLNKLKLVVSADGQDDSLSINQDVSLYASVLEGGSSVEHSFAPGRAGWLQVISGEVEVNGEMLNPGDGLAIEDEQTITIIAQSESEFLLFDVATKS